MTDSPIPIANEYPQPEDSLPQKSTRLKDTQPESSSLSFHIFLFIATVMTTVTVGTFHFHTMDPDMPNRAGLLLQAMLHKGLPFSLALLGILLAHEMGHYFTARHYKVRASLPYFIPFPFGIGTLGAVIKLRSAPRNRAKLLDIGLMGPLVGLIVALPLAIYGFNSEKLVETAGGAYGIQFGDSILTWTLTYLIHGPIPQGMDLLITPVAYAAWLGFFVTALNLMPAGQLDGGHIIYGLTGKKHGLISHLTFLLLAMWGLWGGTLDTSPPMLLLSILISVFIIYLIFSPKTKVKRNLLIVLVLLWVVAKSYIMTTGVVTSIWLIWSAVLYSFGLDHPPARDLHRPLDVRRTIMGWFSMFIFIVTFVPKPITIIG